MVHPGISEYDYAMVEAVPTYKNPCYSFSSEVSPGISFQVHMKTYIHIHSTNPVCASNASEYATCQQTSDVTTFTRKKKHSQDEKKQNKNKATNTITREIKSITEGYLAK